MSEVGHSDLARLTTRVNKKAGSPIKLKYKISRNRKK